MPSTCPTTIPAPPALDEIRATGELLRGRVVRTPVLDWSGPELGAHLAPGTSVNLKLELFQHTGSFKARGALAVMLALTEEVRARGAEVVAIATDGNEDIQHHADDVVFVPRTHPFLQAALAVIPLQLIAYRIARLRGMNVDQPRNLAKTVTVE